MYFINSSRFVVRLEIVRSKELLLDPASWIGACQRYWHPSYCYIIIETRLFEHLLAVRASNYPERAIKRSFKYSSTFDNRMLDFPRRVSLLTGY